MKYNKYKSDINYLSFEGGGGKGNAYLGAVYALQALTIINFNNSKLVGKIKGISGASAGAMTAFFLGSGFNAQELAHLLSKDFLRFFDYPVPGEKVIVGKGFSFIDTKQGEKDLKNAESWIKVALEGFRKTGVFNYLLERQLSKENPELHKKIKDNLKGYNACLIADWGLFSGRTIQEEYFEFWLQYKIYCVKHGIGYSPDGVNQNAHKHVMELFLSGKLSDNPCTFKQHFDIFGVELAFTSVNFRTENVEVFSYKTTPDFPITMAVRMSMSLPIAFKPVLIEQLALTKYSLKPSLAGYWIDGGYFDNAPVRVFNDTKRTVLFRLGNRTESNTITSLWEFIKTYVKIGALGAGSGQVNYTTVPELNVIELDVSGLSLFKFNLSKTELDKLTNTNKKIVNDYFSTWGP